jgi:hypothetical protein
MSSDLVDRLIDTVTRALGYGESAQSVAREAARRRVETVLAEGMAREDGLDGALFRFWVRAIQERPGDLARRLAQCVTPEEYREALICAARAAGVDLPGDVLPFKVRPADDLLAFRFRNVIRAHCYEGAGDAGVRAAAAACVELIKAPETLPLPERVPA